MTPIWRPLSGASIFVSASRCPLFQTFKGVARAWHIALLYNRDPRLARGLLTLFQQERGLVVGDNQPYFVSDTTDYTIPVHGERHGLPHALVEIRQDLIAEDSGQ